MRDQVQRGLKVCLRLYSMLVVEFRFFVVIFFQIFINREGECLGWKLCVREESRMSKGGRWEFVGVGGVGGVVYFEGLFSDAGIRQVFFMYLFNFFFVFCIGLNIRVDIAWASGSVFVFVIRVFVSLVVFFFVTFSVVILMLCFIRVSCIYGCSWLMMVSFVI